MIGVRVAMGLAQCFCFLEFKVVKTFPNLKGHNLNFEPLQVCASFGLDLFLVESFYFAHSWHQSVLESIIAWQCIILNTAWQGRQAGSAFKFPRKHLSLRTCHLSVVHALRDLGILSSGSMFVWLLDKWIIMKVAEHLGSLDHFLVASRRLRYIAMALSCCCIILLFASQAGSSRCTIGSRCCLLCSPWAEAMGFVRGWKGFWEVSRQGSRQVPNVFRRRFRKKV